LKNVDYNWSINWPWENISISKFQLKLVYVVMRTYNQHKRCFDEEFSKVVDERRQTKLKLLRGSGQVKTDNLKNIRPEASRYFGGGGDIQKVKLMNIKQTVRAVLEACTEA
jgi:hypothetical protein